MLNHVVITGRIVKDLELKQTQNGVSVVSFTVACSRDFKSQNGEKEVDFIDCQAWRSSAEFLSKYAKKGSMVEVSGRLQVRNWKDKDGNSRKSVEVVVENVYLNDPKPTGNGQQNQQGYNNAYVTQQPYNPPQNGYQQQIQPQQQSSENYGIIGGGEPGDLPF